MYHGQSDEVIPYASAQKAAAAWCANGASVEFVTETGGTGHLGTEFAMTQTATDWLALRLNGTPPASGCSTGTYTASGLPLKRDGLGVASPLDLFGRGDEKVIAAVLRRIASGGGSENFWEELRK